MPFRFLNGTICRCIARKPMNRTYSYNEVLKVCLPLMMSTAAVTVMEFTDRVFLSNYSLEAISAATPAGIVALVFIIFFSGVSGYASVFIAQYIGAGAFHRVGSALWQAIYFSLAASALLIGLSFLSPLIFSISGHVQEVQELEVVYFRILCLGAGIHVSEAGLSAFFTGRGITRPVMVANISAMLINIPLNYMLIYGFWFIPELGIAGAGIATVIAWAWMLVLYTLLIFRKENDTRFHVLRSRRFDKPLFLRMMQFGVPGGLQSCLDITAFLFFIFMVGRIGKIELAVSNIVIAINSVAFMPAYGFSMGVSTLVGQSMGRGNPGEAKTAVSKAIHLLIVYTLCVDLLYLFAPESILALFIPAGQDTQTGAALSAMGVSLLRIVSVYVFFDAMYMTFAGALRGAGDTRFVMWSIGLASLGIMILPTYIIIDILSQGLFTAWLCVLSFVFCLFAICGLRYRNGKWQTMSVLEQDPAAQAGLPTGN